MNKVEAQTRILRNLAVVQYQVESLGANGQNMSIYTETAVLDALNALSGGGWTNLNAASNNFPVIDLISKDQACGVQATVKTTKAKLDKTIAALGNELKAPSNRLHTLREVQIVGFTCSGALKSWREVIGPTQTVRVRGLTLRALLDLPHRSEQQIDDLDWAMQGLAATHPVHMRSDEDEVSTIVAYLDRPALRDRHHEGDWSAMQEAMLAVRRLLGQGADAQAGQVTRSYATFQPQFRAVLKRIFDDSAAVSRLLRNKLSVRGSMTPAEFKLVEGHRLHMQEAVTELATMAGRTPPRW